jgi:hypothetical protein
MFAGNQYARKPISTFMRSSLELVLFAVEVYARPVRGDDEHPAAWD